MAMRAGAVPRWHDARCTPGKDATAYHELKNKKKAPATCNHATNPPFGGGGGAAAAYGAVVSSARAAAADDSRATAGRLLVSATFSGSAAMLLDADNRVSWRCSDNLVDILSRTERRCLKRGRRAIQTDMLLHGGEGGKIGQVR